MCKKPFIKRVLPVKLVDPNVGILKTNIEVSPGLYSLILLSSSSHTRTRNFK